MKDRRFESLALVITVTFSLLFAACCPAESAQKIEGWCCHDNEVFASYQAECLDSGGNFFDTEEEAAEDCQEEAPPEGWCCLDPDVFPSSEVGCLESGGYFFPTEEEAAYMCQR